MEERLSAVIDALKERMNSIVSYREHARAKFLMGTIPDDAVLPGFDDSGWKEVALPFNWDNRQDACFRIHVKVPGRVEDIEPTGSDLNVRGKSVWANPVMNMHGKLFIDGKLVLEAPNWVDLSFFHRVSPRVTPGDRHVIAVRAYGKEGVVAFYSAMPLVEVRYGKVEEVALGIEAFVQELRFASFLKGGMKLISEALKDTDGSRIRGMDITELLAFVARCEKALSALKKQAKSYRVNLIGYAHIDVNWLWPMEETIQLCRDTALSVEKVMGEHKGLSYMQGQAFTYHAMENRHPDVFEIMKKRIREGTWEPCASSWVELDLNIANGESIAHQILHAKRYMIEKFGYEPKLFISPDTFGHAWTMPQILRKSGIDYYYFMRSSEKDYDIFWWKGPDGSRVLVFNSSYLGGLSPEVLVDTARYYKETLDIDDSLFVYGIGDHGGGPTIEDGKLVKALNERPLYPTLSYGTMERYLDKIGNMNLKLPVFAKEINFIFDGCYTSHWDTKVHNRRCERILIQSEALGSVSSLLGGTYPDLAGHWHSMMTNQFHDILPGSGVHETYEVPNAEAEKIERECGAIVRESLERIAGYTDAEGKGKAVLVFNTLSWERTDVVHVEAFAGCPPNPRVTDGEGNSSDAQIEADKIVFVAGGVPPMGYKVFFITDGSPAGSTIVKDGRTLENDSFILRLDKKTGTIASLCDKKNRRTVLKDRRDEGAYPENTFPVKLQSLPGNIPATMLVRNNLLQVLFEEPHAMSAWVIGPIRRIENLVDEPGIEVAANGPVFGKIRITRRFSSSTISQDITLYAGLGRIDFLTTIDWNEKADHGTLAPMLKASFTPILRGSRATYEIPFGSVERVADGREVPALQWADLSDDEYGISILSDTKHGFDAQGNTLRLTLIRTSYEPDPIPDCGVHSFTYSLYPHKGGWREADTVRRGYELNHALLACPAGAAAGEDPSPTVSKATEFSSSSGKRLPGAYSFLSVQSKGNNVVATCLKKAEGNGDLILRLYECKGHGATVTLSFGFKAKRIEEVDLLERPLSGEDNLRWEKTSAKASSRAAKVKIRFKPYEIKTIRIEAPSPVL